MNEKGSDIFNVTFDLENNPDVKKVVEDFQEQFPKDFGNWLKQQLNGLMSEEEVLNAALERIKPVVSDIEKLKEKKQ